MNPLIANVVIGDLNSPIMKSHDNRKMTFEESYYENCGLWTVDNFGAADQERVATVAARLPADVRTLLDVGCGNGLFLQYLGVHTGRRFDRLCGIDRSTAALASVGTHRVQGSIDALPFGNDEFDAVSCLEVLEHLPQSMFLSALDELSRIAGRYILVTVPYNENLRLSQTECPKCYCRFNPYYHLRTFGSDTMHRLFDRKGFACQETFYMYRQKTVPSGIEVTLRFFGELKRRSLQQPRPPMVTNAVCPACGYSPLTETNGGAKSAHPITGDFQKTVRSVFSLKSGWRWTGALYRRT